MTVVAVIAQGTMGSGVGRRLRESGAEVRTLLSGRSPASAERARAAGMVAAAGERALLEGADFFLSILPPGEAEPLARRLAPTLAALGAKPIYIDCNAVSPQTAIRIGEVIAPTGAHFVDAGIIGGPPRPGYSPAIYASGPTARQTAVLRDWGIDWRVIEGPIGAASAVKMSYAGITKGTTAIAAYMSCDGGFSSRKSEISTISATQRYALSYIPGMLFRMRASICGWLDESSAIRASAQPKRAAPSSIAAAIAVVPLVMPA